MKILSEPAIIAIPDGIHVSHFYNHYFEDLTYCFGKSKTGESCSRQNHHCYLKTEMRST